MKTLGFPQTPTFSFTTEKCSVNSPKANSGPPTSIDEAETRIVAQRIRKHWRSMGRWLFWLSIILGTMAFGVGDQTSNGNVFNFNANAFHALLETLGTLFAIIMILSLLTVPKWRFSDRLWARVWIAKLYGSEREYEDLMQQATDHDVAARAFVLAMLYRWPIRKEGSFPEGLFDIK